MSGLYEIMHDKNTFENPDSFNPERFIDQNTGQLIKVDQLIPFGFGKRMCIGTALAQNELYLFLGAFLQKFQFSSPYPDELEPVAGFVLGCPNYDMKITERS